MSAAFQLQPTGPPAPCGFPKCTLEVFHDDDHKLTEEPKTDRRMEFPGPRYGQCYICAVKFVQYGDHAYPASRVCGSKECGRELARRESKPLQPLRCACPQRPFPHELAVHGKIRREAYNPSLRHCWPWALMLSGRVEPSTEQRETSELMEVCKG